MYELCLKAETDQDFLESEEFNNEIQKFIEYESYCRTISSELKNTIQRKNQQIHDKILQTKVKHQVIESKDLLIKKLETNRTT